MCIIYCILRRKIRFIELFVFQNALLIYATSYIYGQLVKMMDHIQGTAWALMSQFLSKFSSISHGAINC